MQIKTKQNIAHAMYTLLAVVLAIPIILSFGWLGVALIAFASAGVLFFLHWLETRRF